MSVVGDVESVKAVIATIAGSTVFSDQLAAVNAEKNDGYTSAGLAAIYDYERAEIEAYPCLEIVGLTETYNPDEDVKDDTIRVALIFTVVGDNEQTLTKDVERLMRTARDVFWRSVLNGAVGAAPVTVETGDYSELTRGQNQPFMKGGRLILAVPTLAN